jgi:hypothetical protein
MIITTCAACAAPLAHDAPRCVRCQTRYCDNSCLKQCRGDSPTSFCEARYRQGGAEQFYANRRAAEAAEEAGDAYAHESPVPLTVRGTQGTVNGTGHECLAAKALVCVICRVRHDEPLVRCGCGCKAKAALFHVSCLVTRAQVAIHEGTAVQKSKRKHSKERKAGESVPERWARWYSCKVCDQEYSGPLRCALAWACWRTYLGRRAEDPLRVSALSLLGTGLYQHGRWQEALDVYEVDLAARTRNTQQRASLMQVLDLQMNIAECCAHLLSRGHEALAVRRIIYQKARELKGVCEKVHGIPAAQNLAISLINAREFAEAKTLLREAVPAARKAHGQDAEPTLQLTDLLALALTSDPAATQLDLRESIAILEEASRLARSSPSLGTRHPITGQLVHDISRTRAAILARLLDKIL